MLLLLRKIAVFPLMRLEINNGINTTCPQKHTFYFICFIASAVLPKILFYTLYTLNHHHFWRICSWNVIFTWVKFIFCKFDFFYSKFSNLNILLSHQFFISQPLRVNMKPCIQGGAQIKPYRHLKGPKFVQKFELSQSIIYVTYFISKFATGDTVLVLSGFWLSNAENRFILLNLPLIHQSANNFDVSVHGWESIHG